MKIFTISGHAQNGKDTVSKIIKDKLEMKGNKVLVAHFGDLLKYICKTFFGWNGKKDLIGRQLLQYVGTDVVREKKPDFWVEFMSDILQIFNNEWDYVIISDTRFPNEIELLKWDGFDVTHIRVNRSNFESPLSIEQQMHISETALDDVKADFYIDNSGSLEDLESVITKWIDENL